MAKLAADEIGGIKVLRSLIRPFLRFCMGQSYTAREITRVVKEELVKLAEEEIILTGKRPNVSKIALMTGLDRRDVKKLFSEDATPPKRPVVSPIGRVLTQWQTDPAFTTSSGKPRVLVISEELDEFRDLVEAVTTDYYSGTMLKELLRLGIVEETRKGIKLIHWHNRLGLGSDPESGFELLAEDMSTLIRAVEENILERKEIPNAHIRTEYDNVYRESLPAVRKWLTDENEKFHGRVRQFLAKHDADLTPRKGENEAGKHVVITSFSLTSGWDDNELSQHDDDDDE